MFDYASFTWVFSLNITSNGSQSSMIWYTANLLVLIIPQEVPFVRNTVTFSNSSHLSNSLQSPKMNYLTYSESIAAGSKISDYCYYDTAQTMKDKVTVIFNLQAVSLINPDYVNVTSSSNWAYDWDDANSRISIDLNLFLHSDPSPNWQVRLEILSLCPNSYKFA